MQLRLGDYRTCTEQKHSHTRQAPLLTLSVAALSIENAVLSIESPRFLGIPRKHRFLKGAEHTYAPESTP